MLSLKSLKSIEVKVIDNVLPVVVHEIIELSDEDAYDVEVTPEVEVKERNEVGINMLITMFKGHCKNIKSNILEKYKAAWCRDMEQLIADNGITTEEFLLCLNQ